MDAATDDDGVALKGHSGMEKSLYSKRDQYTSPNEESYHSSNFSVFA